MPLTCELDGVKNWTGESLPELAKFLLERYEALEDVEPGLCEVAEAKAAAFLKDLIGSQGIPSWAMGLINGIGGDKPIKPALQAVSSLNGILFNLGWGMIEGKIEEFINSVPELRSAMLEANVCTWQGEEPTNPVNPSQPPSKEWTYTLEKVGETARAPMAMFGNNEELVVSVISRKGMSKTPVYSARDGRGLHWRSDLPELCESGHYGFRDDVGDLVLVPESHGGMVRFIGDDTDGPWEKVTTASRMKGIEYTNLKWGFAFKCPKTRGQFLGYGNSGHQGCVFFWEEGSMFSYPPLTHSTLRFPTGIATYGGGFLVSSCASANSQMRIHRFSYDGKVAEEVARFDGWGLIRQDHANEYLYAVVGKGIHGVHLDHGTGETHGGWRKLMAVPGIGEPNIHPKTGNMIFPIMDAKRGSTTIYEAVYDESRPYGLWYPRFRKVAFTADVGQWAAKTGYTNSRMYFGSGLSEGKEPDACKGIVYELKAS